MCYSNYQFTNWTEFQNALPTSSINYNKMWEWLVYGMENTLQIVNFNKTNVFIRCPKKKRRRHNIYFYIYLRIKYGYGPHNKWLLHLLNIYKIWVCGCVLRNSYLLYSAADNAIQLYKWLSLCLWNGCHEDAHRPSSTYYVPASFFFWLGVCDTMCFNGNGTHK